MTLPNHRVGHPGSDIINLWETTMIIDDLSLLFHLPCGCDLLYRFPNQTSLKNCLTLYPLISSNRHNNNNGHNQNEDSSVYMKYQSTPAWIESVCYSVVLSVILPSPTSSNSSCSFRLLFVSIRICATLLSKVSLAI
uniref:Uncharacterized protein n=1 Tax=Trichobilharzia regenti TaxID=157069 RepID=A0AA85JPW1_TRIRE|nr:unnamed protein product [Trichobilharzia regenti]